MTTGSSCFTPCCLTLGAVSLRHTVGLDFHQPLPIDEPLDLHEGGGWLDVGEGLPVRACRGFPLRDIGKHDPRPNNASERKTGVVDRLSNDLEATLGLAVDVSRRCNTA